MNLDPIKFHARNVPVSWLLDYLITQDISLDDAAQSLNLSDAAGWIEKRELPLNIYLKLFEWAARELDDALLGAKIAHMIQAGELGILGHLVSNGASLRESLDYVERYHCIFSTNFAFRFNYTRNNASCTYLEAPTTDSIQQDVLFSIGGILNIIRNYSSGDWQPRKCSFSFPKPDDVSQYRSYFGDNIHFDQPHNAFEFETQLLQKTRDNSDPSLLPILLQQANLLFEQIDDSKNLAEKVRLLILTALGAKPITTQRAAEHLNMSVRSLHRQLGLQDTSFKKLREEVIIKVAKEALLNSNLSITAIAGNLNYSEISSFDRLFKRLTGSTPRQYRAQHSAQ